MDKSKIHKLTASLQQLFEQFYSGPIRVVIAKDRDVEVIVSSTGVAVFADVEKRKEVANLEKGRAIRFTIVGWPISNSKGQMMVPIHWQGETCYVDARWFSETDRGG